MKLIVQFILLSITLAGCSIGNISHKSSSQLGNEKIKHQQPHENGLQKNIIDSILLKLPNIRAEKIANNKNAKIFAYCLGFCSDFESYEPYITSDNSWLFFNGDDFITFAREFDFSDSAQANRFALETKRLANIFYTTPRNQWNSQNVGCWPNYTDKFYAVIHKGNKVMLIGDGDKYNYYFEAGDAIKDYHRKNNTDLYVFLNELSKLNLNRL